MTGFASSTQTRTNPGRNDASNSAAQPFSGEEATDTLRSKGRFRVRTRKRADPSRWLILAQAGLQQGELAHCQLIVRILCNAVNALLSLHTGPLSGSASRYAERGAAGTSSARVRALHAWHAV